MILTVFRSRLRPEHVDEYRPMAARMHDLAQSMPGYIESKTYESPDGDRVTIVAFESWPHHDAWRSHPEHREAQRLGREKFYSEFRITVAEVVRDYGWSA